VAKQSIVLPICVLVLAACSEPPSFMGRWLIERVESAPWVAARTPANSAIANLYVGKTVTFEENRIDGPELLTCANPKYNFVEVPAEGLFQGGLAQSDADTAKAQAAAEKLGFETQPVQTVTTGCEHDIAFHLRNAEQAAFALDNMIFWMKRAR